MLLANTVSFSLAKDEMLWDLSLKRTSTAVCDSVDLYLERGCGWFKVISHGKCF